MPNNNSNYPTGPLAPPQMPAQPGQSMWQDLPGFEKPEIPGQNMREMLSDDEADEKESDTQSIYGI